MQENTFRVLHVFGVLNRGGAETMIMNLYQAIDRKKVQFDFVVHTDMQGAYDETVKMLGGHIYHAPRYRGINHFAYIKWWNNFFEEHPEHSIIHSHIRSTAGIFFSVAKRQGRITIAHSHSTSNGSGIAAVAKNLFQRGIVHYADYLFACSDAAGEWLFGKKAIAKGNYHVLKNAINIQEFGYDEAARKKIREEFGLEDSFVMGTVGRMSVPKNPFGIVKIIQAVCAQLPDAKFLWVGAGELEDDIKQRIRDSSIDDNVVFTGVRSDIPALLSAMDVFVFPSLWEGLGLSVIEAQASGLKCLISETITHEACVTPNVSRLSIESTSDWVREILEIQRKPFRSDVAEYILRSGYDITATAVWIQEFYLTRSFTAYD